MDWANGLSWVGQKYATLEEFRTARKASRDAALEDLRAGKLDLAQAIEVCVIGEVEWWDPSCPS